MTVPVAIAEIAQQACIALERTPPSSLDDDTDLARALAAFYPMALERCLEAADWSFASRLAYLPPVALANDVTRDVDLPYPYSMPADCSRLIEVGGGIDAWRRDGDVIWASAPPPLRVRYTFVPAAETRLPAEFRSAVAHTLALILAPIWLQTASKMESIERRAGADLKRAMRNHARDASPVRYDGQPDQGDWVLEARR